MSSRSRGFTLVELMIVVVIVGVLAAIAIPNFIAMQSRAKEGSLKVNMHTFHLAAEDVAVQNEGVYAASASTVAAALPGLGARFLNPFTQGIGDGVAWEDRGSYAASPSATTGITSYADSARATFNIKGYGRHSMLAFVVGAGQ